MPREGGASSTPRLFRIPLPSLEYWIARPSAQLRTRRAMTAVYEAIAAPTSAVQASPNLLRSNEQFSSDPRQFLMASAVAFLAPHHMMNVILLTRHPREFLMAEAADPVVIVSAAR